MVKTFSICQSEFSDDSSYFKISSPIVECCQDFPKTWNFDFNDECSTPFSVGVRRTIFVNFVSKYFRKSI